MSTIVYDENMHVYLLDTALTDVSDVTLADVSGGVDVTAQVTKDGVSFSPTNNRVPDGDLSTRFNAEKMGTYSYQLALTFKRKTGPSEDVAWDTLTHLWTGTVVIVPFGAAATLEDCYVFNCEAGIAELAQSAENEHQKFTVPFAVSDLDLRAVIDGGS